MNTIQKAIGYVIIIIALVLISYGGWRLSRWFNWKFDYGNKVGKIEKRVEALEERVKALE